MISHSSRTTQPATGWARKIAVNASAIRGYDLGDTAISLAGLGGRLGERHARVYLPKGARGRRGIPTATLLPYCEGDGSNQQGQHFYDDSLYADPVPGTSPAVMIRDCEGLPQEGGTPPRAP